MSKECINIIIIEDDQDFIFLIKQLFSDYAELNFSGYASEKNTAIKLAKETQPDIVLLDLNLSNTGLDGIEAAREIRSSTNAKIIILSSFEDEQTVIRASMECFASNYIFKSNYASIVNTVKETARGHTAMEYLIYNQIISKLSDAEKNVYNTMLGEGISLKSSPKTIANQKTKVFAKLGVKNQMELRHIFGKWVLM